MSESTLARTDDPVDEARPDGPVEPGSAPAGDRYGWVVVGLAFTILAITCGLTFYAMAAYIDSLVEESGFSLAVASAGPTMSAIVGGLGGLSVARMMRSIPIRTLLLIGAVGSGAAIAGIGAAQTTWQLWLAFAASGWFTAMASGIPLSALVARWFPAAPARPLTLAMTGLAFGGAVVPPVVLVVLGAFGLAKGSAIIGVVMTLLVGAAVMFLREPPAHLAAAAAAGSAAPGASSHPPTVRTRLFGLLFLGFMALVMSQVATTTHIVRLTNENGIGAAGLAVSTLAIGSFTGRLAGIPLLTAVGLRRLTFGVGILQGASQLVLATAHTTPHLLIGAFLLGLAMGNVVVLMSLFAIEAYGLVEYPRMFARLNLAGPLASGFGPLVVGVLHGALDGYLGPLILMGAASVVGTVALFATGVDTERSVRRRRV
jgi:hypothetical protein